MSGLLAENDDDVGNPQPLRMRSVSPPTPIIQLLPTVDFKGTPIGPPDSWDPSLKLVTALMFESQFPMFVAWGAELTLIYNDAYAEILGGKHPAAFGARFKDVWHEIWDEIVPLVDKAMSGITTYSEDLPLTMNRAGYDERSWFTFSYSPVRDHHGVVQGMFCAVTETTERVMLQQRQELRLFLEETLRTVGDPGAALTAATEALKGALGVAGGGYAEIRADHQHLRADQDGPDGGQLEGPALSYLMHDFAPAFMVEFKAGRVIAIDDIALNERIAVSAEAYSALQLRSVLAVPLVKDGVLRMILVLYHTAPRKWLPHEITLATDIVERTWSAVEYAKSRVEKTEYTNRLDFLDALGKETALLRNADAIMEATTRSLGQHLGVSSCAYADMDEDGDGFTIRGDWAAPGAVNITGHYHLRDFGKLAVAELSAGRPLVINDNLKEIEAAEAATFQSIGITATICMPLVKGDRLTALMAVHHASPHQWTPHELALVREVTERSWAHIERVRSEAELLASQAQLRRTNETLEAMVVERTGELMAAEETLRQAQKMEAVGQLTGGLAHDFNNLLAGVLGSLEVIKSRLAQGRLSEIDRYLTAAVGAAKRGASLTQRMLAFSRRQTLAPKPTDVNKLVSSMEELIRRSTGPEIAVEVVQMPEAWPALVDEGQLENALLNLCINGRDAMPDGGTLTIETANRFVDLRMAPQLGLSAGEYLCVSVTDTGTGMAADVISRAFDPFFTTKPIGEGTGLGLSMVWGFAGQSGGSARIASQLGKGTVVSIYIPRYVGEVELEEPAPLARPLDAIVTRTVLLVDDEPLIRMVAAEQLEELGYVVIEAGEARDAIKVLEMERKIDLLLTDVGLPNGMNGRQLAEIAREKRPGLPVLFITGYAETAVLNHGHLQQGMQILTKPFDLDALANHVKACIEAS